MAEQAALPERVALSDDERLVRRGRRTFAGSGAALVVAALGLFAFSLVTGSVEPVTLELALVAVLVVYGLAALAWAAWLLLAVRGGGTASTVRQHESIAVLLSDAQFLTMALVLGIYAWVRRTDDDVELVLLIGVPVVLGIARAGEVVRRRYPALPRDRPRWQPQPAVASWAGWYDDYDDRRLQRHWDGAAWTDQVRERGAHG